MNSTSPVITIATVTYNAASTLPPTLDSVAQQDYPYIEHLIVDGCSTDDTLSLLHQYVERNTQAVTSHDIRVLCERDEGLYDAMNKAIQQAQGAYLVFLNAGDTLASPGTISLLAAKSDWIKGDYSNPAILYGQTDLVDAERNFVRHRRLQAPEKLHWRQYIRGMLVCHQSFYVRTDLAREVPYDLHYRYSADFDWCIRLLKLAEKRRLQIVNANEVLTHYLSEGLTTRHHRASLLERMRIMAHHFGWFRTLLAHAFFVLRALFCK